MGSAGAKSNNLVAIGSAAVMAVYAAGYVRTKPAADELDRELTERPITRPIPRIESAHAAIVIDSPQPDTARDTSGSGPRHPIEAHPPAPSNPKATAAKKQAAAASEPTRDSVMAAPDSAKIPAQTQAPDSAQAPDRGPYKDGLYFGWGRSRHGDIQAGVEIKNGRIKSAFISECLTQYSCTWISALPPQVVTRQSPDVDYVSGATQSTNAFYFAVVQALGQAK